MVILYTVCEEACVFLQGFILGIDLKYFGILYAAALIGLSVVRLDIPFLMLLTIGVGAELFLLGYQVMTGLYCYFCLSFAALVVFLFALNLKAFLKHAGKEVVSTTAIVGLIMILLLFRGASVKEDRGNVLLPSYGSGKVEVRLYTDFGCPHCQVLEVKAAPLIRELVEKKLITIVFVNTIPDSLFGKHFLYILKSHNEFETAMRARAALFEAERLGIVSRPRLEAYLKEKGIEFTPFDVGPTLRAMRRLVERDRITATPACVFYEEYSRRSFTGVAEILAALQALKE